MSKEEAVQAYLQGRLTRRAFIRTLIGAGVSVTAAVTYADVLGAQVSRPPRAARDLYDLYDLYGGPGQRTGTTVAASTATAASPVAQTPSFTG